MRWLRRAAARVKPARGGPARAGSARADDATTAHLTNFVRTRVGVEAFVEPQTTVTRTTILLIAHDGEWTRRVVPSPEWAYAFAEHLRIPGYDALVVGYPQRMRDFNTRARKRPGGTAEGAGPAR